MIRKIYISVFIIILGSNCAKAQEVIRSSNDNAFDQLFSFAWDVNIPTGNKFVDATSWAGGRIEFRKMLKNNISIGTDLSWNSYYEYKSYQTYSVNATTDITTDLYKYNYTLPMALLIHKYFPSDGILVPYVGFGIGATYSEPRLIFNIYELIYDNWGFLIRPEVGAIIKFDRAGDVGAIIGARYSYSTNSEEDLHIESLESIGFQLGICWTY